MVRRPRRLLALGVLLPGFLNGVTSAATMHDPTQAWSEPVAVALPSATVVLELSVESAPDAWAARHGETDYVVFPLGGDGALIELANVPVAGDARRLTLDDGPGVSNLEPVRCQAIQLDVGWRTNAAEDAPVTAQLLRRAPSLSQVLEGETGAPGACDGVDPYAEGVRRLGVTPDGARLDDADLPADMECWTLAIESSCGVVETPLDSVVPDAEPMRLLAVLDAANAPQASAIAASHGLSLLRVVPLRATGETLALLTAGTPQDAQTALATLAADTRVSGVQREYRYKTAAYHADPLAALAYGPEKTGAVRLHPLATGKGTLIAVIDTGVDVKHPELAGRIEAHVDLTDSGFGNDLHGTAVAGIIAARSDNAEGAYGVAPDARLLLLKACAPLEPEKLASRCWTSTIVAALDEAMARDARVVNLSLGGPPDPLVARFVGLAREQGRILVAAAGNGGAAAKPAFPAALPGVIAVTATDVRDAAYRVANEGSYIALSAPGVDIVSPAPGGAYPALSGTSMAAAHVSAVAALLLQIVPGATADVLLEALRATAVDLGAAGIDDRFGAGRIDACVAAARLSSEAVVCAQ